MTRIPASFDRYSTTKLKCRSGFIYVRPISGGASYQVSATGQRNRIMPAADVRWYVAEVAKRLDESASRVACALLEDDDDVDPKEMAMGLPMAYIIVWPKTFGGKRDGYFINTSQPTSTKWVPDIYAATKFATRQAALEAVAGRYARDNLRVIAVPHKWGPGIKRWVG